jgi:hypothetical protein
MATSKTKERKETSYSLTLEFISGARRKFVVEAQGLLNAVRSIRAFHPESRVVSVALDKRQHA